MYLTFTEKGGRKYASAATSSRDGDKTSIEYVYLGRVASEDGPVFYARERGYFTFDLATGAFGPAPESFAPPKVADGRKREASAFDFGDAFLINEIMCRSGMWEVIDALPWANKATLRAMTAYYVASSMPNRYADMWYAGSVAHLLFPGANLESGAVSDLLERLGSAEAQTAYHSAMIPFVLSSFSPDTNVMVDSTGMPNKCSIHLTRANVHNGRLSVEARVIVVAQRSTGLPLFFKVVPGSVNDAMTLRPVMEHCRALGIDVSGCLIDAGYSTDINLDEFYDSGHRCAVDYITRPKSSASYYKEALRVAAPALESGENFVDWQGRYAFVKRVEVMVGKGSDQPAYLYIGLDKNRESDELHKLLRRAKREGLSPASVYELMGSQGIFALLSGRPYEPSEILAEYYVRQGIEQLNDVSKNYAKLLPARCHKWETFEGHVVLSMAATAVARIVQMRLNELGLCLGPRLEALRQQKVICYATRAVPDVPVKEANEVYRAFGIDVPASIPMRDGRLAYENPRRIDGYLRPAKRGRRPGKAKAAKDEKKTATEADGSEG